MPALVASTGNPRRAGRPLGKRPARVAKLPRALSAKQRTFLERYLLCFSAAQAYREAYNANHRTAYKEGPLLLRHPLIAPEIKARMAEITKRFAPMGKKALGELAAIAFSNVQDFFDSQGKLKPIDQLPAHAAAAIKKVKSKAIEAIDVASGETKVVGCADELELHDKIAALRMIGQHEGLFAERIELAPGTDFVAALREARSRALAMRGELVELAPIDGEKVAK